MSDVTQEVAALTSVFRQSLAQNAGGPGRASATGQPTLSVSSEVVDRYLQDVSAVLQRARAEKRSVPDDLYVDLSGIYFGTPPNVPDLICGIRFDGSVFIQVLKMDNVEIIGQVHIPNARFRRGVKFDGSTFHAPLKLEGAHLGDKVPQAGQATVLSLKGCVVKQSAVIPGHLHGAMDLSEATFEKDLTVVGEFADNVLVLMQGAKVTGSFRLSSSGKGILVLAERAIFEGPADFTAIGRRHFGRVALDAAEFQKKASFRNAIFQDEVSFRGAHLADIDMSQVQTSPKPLDFSGAEVCGLLDLKGAVLDAGPNFSRTDFAKCPRIEVANFPHDTSMRSAKFRGFSTEEDRIGYRVLKKEFSSYHAREEENMFFAYEQRTRCNLDLRARKRIFQSLLSKGYDWGTEYGQNAGRPVCWFLLLTVGAWGAYAATCGEVVTPVFEDTWAVDLPSGLGLALQSAVNPLALFSGKAPFRPSSGLVALAVGAQSFFSLVFVALALLAVRRRFRKETD